MNIHAYTDTNTCHTYILQEKKNKAQLFCSININYQSKDLALVSYYLICSKKRNWKYASSYPKMRGGQDSLQKQSDHPNQSSAFSLGCVNPSPLTEWHRCRAVGLESYNYDLK